MRPLATLQEWHKVGLATPAEAPKRLFVQNAAQKKARKFRAF
jgi:hypothetical protein